MPNLKWQISHEGTVLETAEAITSGGKVRIQRVSSGYKFTAVKAGFSAMLPATLGYDIHEAITDAESLYLK